MYGAFILLTMHLACPAQTESPGQIISKMFAKYAYADSLSGKIVQTYSDGAGTVTVNTVVKYVRPNLLLVEQDRKGQNGLPQKAISDGVVFMYDPPVKDNIAVEPNKRLFEPVKGMLSGTQIPFNHDVGYLYNIAHLSLSPSTALDIAIGFNAHLKDLNIHIASLNALQSVTYKGKRVHRITGRWQHNRSAGPTGTFEMLVSHEHDFLKLVHTANYQSSPTNTNPRNVVTLTTTEEANFTVNAKVDKKVFIYRRNE